MFTIMGQDRYIPAQCSVTVTPPIIVPSITRPQGDPSEEIISFFGAGF